MSNKITYSKLKIVGFGSIRGPLLFNLNKPGLTIIQGDNGAGKTSILNALTWVQWGDLLKKGSSIAPWPELGYTEGTMVSLKFRKGDNKYEIVRCKDYKGKIVNDTIGKDQLILMENGTYRADLRGNNAVSAEVKSILGFSFKLFSNSMVFGQKVKRLIEETGPDKKKIFEEIFETQFIEEAKSRVETEKKNVLVALSRVTPEVSALKAKIEQNEGFLTMAERQEANFEKQKQSKLGAIRESIKGFRKEKEELELTPAPPTALLMEWKLELKRLEGTLDAITHGSNTLELKQRQSDLMFEENNLTGVRARIKLLRKELETPPSICPKCGESLKPLKARKLRNDTLELLKELESSEVTHTKAIESYGLTINVLETAVGKYSDTKKECDRLNKEISGLQDEISDYNGISTKISNLETKMQGKKEELKRIKKEKPPKTDIDLIRKTLQAFKEDLKPQEEKYDALKREMEILDWLVKDPLSSTGIKTFIFDGLVEKVNAKLRTYADYIGFLPEFVVDMDSSKKDIEQVLYKNDVIVPYEDLSGGQGQLVNVSNIFAAHDVVNENKPTNLLIMDEVFEGLDSKNIELINELILSKVDGKSIFLITHRAEFIPLNAAIIKVELVNGFTEIVD